MAEKDQLFSNMRRAALEWLNRRSPGEICTGGNVIFDGEAFHLQSLGKNITVTYPEYEVFPPLHHWHTLTLLHYLAFGDGTPPSDRLMTFAQHKDGMIRGGDFDRRAEVILREELGQLSEGELRRRCRLLGGEEVDSNGDLCVKFLFFPNYPVYLKLWFPDEEFPASGRLLLDETAQHYLSVEDAVAIGEVLLDDLRGCPDDL